MVFRCGRLRYIKFIEDTAKAHVGCRVSSTSRSGNVVSVVFEVVESRYNDKSDCRTGLTKCRTRGESHYIQKPLN
jgi:hypothetical protein